jgi:predicted adenine nucleotide alpha hydrolase (AANH) superfamily ATPase
VADKNALIYRTFPLNAEEAHRKGIELSKKHNIYRQKYCGCEFSLPKQA